MAPGTDAAQRAIILSEQILRLSERAAVLAAEGDFAGLAEVIDGREKTISAFQRLGDIRRLPGEWRQIVIEALSKAVRTDDEIRLLLREEMNMGIQAIEDAVTSSKALSAYDPAPAGLRRFDRRQ